MKNTVLIFIFSSVCIFCACKKKIRSLYSSEYEEFFPGGENGTVFDETSLAFSYKFKGMSSQQNQEFFVGNSFFNQNWVESPASTTARDGLGPLFNTKSCTSCHFRDGRGAPNSGEGLLFRLSIPSSNIAPEPDPIYGGQLQDFAVSAANAEGDISIQYTESIGTYPDGTTYSLRIPHYSITNLNYGAISPDIMISPRVGNQMIGLGLLEIIDESDIIVRADEFDLDGDGISGRANYVHDVSTGTTMLGRFGWKANTATLITQVAAAFNGDIGIKTSYFPNENYTINQAPALSGLPDGGIVEVTDDDLLKVVHYCRTLRVPARRNSNGVNEQKGKLLFRSLECNKCHVEKHITGNSGDVSVLKNAVIYPFTDLLLHDMGDELSDNRPDHLATGNEWRTAPLWGIGLFPTVNNHQYLLHDGRARNVEEAILWHGGEAESHKEAFKKLEATERQQLIDFVNSL
ncbi:MAG: thiol oxidoreductase [Crocinitomicaceae bacterium]|nr:thiol oxidoreductase [Crocinitomicaceae bacterium]